MGVFRSSKFHNSEESYIQKLPGHQKSQRQKILYNRTTSLKRTKNSERASRRQLEHLYIFSFEHLWPFAFLTLNIICIRGPNYLAFCWWKSNFYVVFNNIGILTLSRPGAAPSAHQIFACRGPSPGPRPLRARGEVHPFHPVDPPLPKVLKQHCFCTCLHDVRFVNAWKKAK
jgi:hypothetical protein